MSNQPKALFISIDGMTDPLGRSQVLPYLLGLSEHFKIYIASCEKDKNYHRNVKEVEELLKEHEIEWQCVPYQTTIPLYSQYKNYKSLKRLALEMADANQFSIVHSRSLLPGIIGRILQKTLGLKFIYDMRGFWADEKVEGGSWKLSNPIFSRLYHYFKRKERRLFQKADYIISLTQKGRDYILEHYKTKGKIQVIPCSTNLEHFDYMRFSDRELIDLRSQMNIRQDEFVLSYIGSLGTRYRLREMIDFFSKLKEREPKTKFLFISRHDAFEIKKAWKAAKLDPSDLRIQASEYAEIPKYIAIANASIFFIVTGFTGKAVSPTKQAEVMAMGLPIVANTGIGDSAEILANSGAGVLIENYDEASLSVAAEELLNSVWDKESIRKSALDHYSLKKAVENYMKVYRSLLSS